MLIDNNCFGRNTVYPYCSNSLISGPIEIPWYAIETFSKSHNSTSNKNIKKIICNYTSSSLSRLYILYVQEFRVEEVYYYPSFYLLIIISMHVKDRQGVSWRCTALGTSIHNYGGHNNILCIL